ncbi:MAG: O-antigen polymerase [Planctomycetota bacterium]
MKDLRRNYLKVGLFAGLGVLHGLVPAITPYHLLDPVFSYDSRVFATFYSLSMVIVIIIGWSLYEHFRPHSKVGIVRLLDAISSRQGRTLYKRLFWATAILGILGIVIRVHATGSSILGMAYAMRLAYRFEANPVLNMLGFYLLSFSLAPGFLGFFLSRQYRIWGVVYTLVIAALCFFAISKGTRALPLGLCGSVLFGYFLQKSMDVRRLAGIGCGGLVILWLAISLYEVRHEMSSMSAGEIMGMMFSPDVAADMLTRDPLNYNENLVGAVATFPSQHPFLAGATYRRMLLFLVPRRLCPGLKPEDPNKIFAMEAFNTAVNLETTIPPTIPGDCYINFGAVGGLFALGGYGIFFAWVSEKLRSSVLWFTAIAPQFVKLLLLGMRGQPYELLVMCLFVLFGTWLLGFLVSMPFKGLQQALTPHRRNSRSAVGQPKPFASPTVGKV